MDDKYTFNDLKHMAKSLLDRAETANEESLRNGLKMFNIAFLNLAEKTSALDRYQAELLLNIVHRETGYLT